MPGMAARGGGGLWARSLCPARVHARHGDGAATVLLPCTAADADAAGARLLLDAARVCLCVGVALDNSNGKDDKRACFVECLCVECKGEGGPLWPSI